MQNIVKLALITTDEKCLLEIRNMTEFCKLGAKQVFRHTRRKSQGVAALAALKNMIQLIMAQHSTGLPA